MVASVQSVAFTVLVVAVAGMKDFIVELIIGLADSFEVLSVCCAVQSRYKPMHALIDVMV